jgi:alcohol dehydrogenase class IV
MFMSKEINFELRKFVAPEFIFGNASRKLAANYARNLGGKKVFLVTDTGIEIAGWEKEISLLLDNEGFETVIFDEVSPNPRDFEVMKGAELYLSAQCDVIIALGGGSVMDCAKGVGIIVSNGGNINDYEGVDQISVPMPPLICIPTTGGTSADVSQFAIINNTSERYKFAVISKSVVPDIALIDPETLVTMSPYLTACTGIDAMVHAIEAFVSNASSPITDLHALEAIRLISENLIESVQNPDDIKLRHFIMLASLQAGLAFSNASLGCVHSMAHSLGGYLDLPHGECNALLLPHVINYNYEFGTERYLKIGETLGIDMNGVTEKERRKKLFDFIVDFSLGCGITGGLSERGVNISDINPLADKAIADPCNATNPRSPTKEDLETIYRESL